MRSWLLAVVAALAVHAVILLFGGVFFMDEDAQPETEVEVDLLEATEDPAEEPAPEPENAPPEVEVVAEAPPEMPEVVEAAPQVEPTDLVARLDALSLGALESALGLGGEGAGFGGALSLASGGRIGGTGVPGAGGEGADSPEDAVFDIGALDQGPRILHQVQPFYPHEMRRRKIEGTVVVVFVVDTNGRVLEPKIEATPHEGFRAPALEAVRRWKFEPAVVRGEKVRSRMRVPIRFSG